MSDKELRTEVLPRESVREDEVIIIGGEIAALKKAEKWFERTKHVHDADRAALLETRRMLRQKRAELKRLMRTAQERLF